MKGMLPLGRLLATPGALDRERITALLARHAMGDWGSVDAEDWAANNKAVAIGERVLSAYPIDPAQPSVGRANRVWIITERDRSATTVLLPEEY